MPSLSSGIYVSYTVIQRRGFIVRRGQEETLGAAIVSACHDPFDRAEVLPITTRSPYFQGSPQLGSPSFSAPKTRSTTMACAPAFEPIDQGGQTRRDRETSHATPEHRV